MNLITFLEVMLEDLSVFKISEETCDVLVNKMEVLSCLLVMQGTVWCPLEATLT